MTLTEIFTIIIVHFIADFIFQDEKWAVGKSTSFILLTYHTFTYSVLWYFPILFLLKYNSNIELHILPYIPVIFALITFICHTITDFITSKITSKLYKQGKFGSAIPNFGFFTVIGFDQCLHMLQLFLTYHYLIK